MKKCFRPWGRLLFISLSLFALFGSLKMNAYAQNKKQTVRVGFPIINGMSMKNENGSLSGYDYDYLMEISQYTGWKYEFVFFDGTVDEQITESMEMLKNGEIDLLGGIYYDTSMAEEYAYPGICYGINYAGIFVPEDSSLREASLYNFDNIRVGVHSKSLDRSERLDQFSKMNNLRITQVITESADEFYQMIDDHKADSILSTDMAVAEHGDKMFSIAHFSPMPFYFITTKGNTDIVQQLDYALTTIDQVNPDFMSQLYKQYFSSSDLSVSLSEDEKQYINNCGTLEVVMYDNKPPFQLIDQDTGKPAGITVEVLEQIAKTMGFTFHYNTVSSYEEYIEFVKSGKADIAADVFSNYQDAIDVDSSLTLPWCSLPISLVFKEGTEYNENGRFAIPYFLKNIVTESENIIYYDSVKECIEAVRKGTADFCYAGEFCSQYFLNKTAYSSLRMLNRGEYGNQKLCFGICDANNIDLHTIFNKGISNLPEETISEIIYRNTYLQQQLNFAMILKENRGMAAVVTIALVLLILVIIFYVKNRQQKSIAFENKRYMAISNLANEYFYEYNLREDELVLSEKCADYFGCNRQITGFAKRLSMMEPDDTEGIWQLGHYMIKKEEGSYELTCRMKDQSLQWFKIITSIVYNQKNEMHAVGKITNIQELKTEHLRLKQQASTDGLTGIYNILTFKNMILKNLEHYEACTPCALIILDIDNFKQINDHYGHDNGDIILIETAKMITDIFSDYLYARMGGDEFIIFMRQTDQAEIEEKCGWFCKAVMELTQENLGDTFTCSMGIAWADKDISYDELYKKADTALYKVKTTTKNGYTFYEP